MVNWILVILILLGVFVLFKTTGVKWGKTWTIIVSVLIIFFLVTFGFVITRPGADVTSIDGFSNSVKVYFIWLGGFFDNTASITGNVIKTNWTDIPENKNIKGGKK